MIGVEMIIYIDYLLLGILVFLSVFACSYCFFRIYQLRRSGQLSSTNIGVLLRPTKVLFAHSREGESTEELRTVVAYQNPFTGDYCIHKSRIGPKGYVNSAQIPDSPDSGVSDEYEPLNLEPQAHVNLPEAHGMSKIVHVPISSDSGVGDGNDPLNLTPQAQIHLPDDHGKKKIVQREETMKVPEEPIYDNSVNKTWNWTYKEYQI